MKPDTIFPIFMGFLAVMGLSSFLMFHVNKDASFKRKYFPVAMIFMGIVVAGFFTIIVPAWEGLLIVYPAIVLISYLNNRMTKFCGKCGATNYNRMFFLSMNYCQKCGEPFDKNSERDRGRSTP